MQITIGFSKHKGFAPMSNAIRWYLGTPFSHCYIKIKLDEFNDSSVLHAIGKGVVIMSYNNFLTQAESIKEFDLEISEDLYKEICDDFHKLVGVTKYGFGQNIGILIARALKLKKNPINDGVNCSEWAAYCLEEIDPDMWNSKEEDFNLITPLEVFNYLKDNI
jgi:hypothetical protein